jgi:hypothetical protein
MEKNKSVFLGVRCFYSTMVYVDNAEKSLFDMSFATQKYRQKRK